MYRYPKYFDTILKYLPILFLYTFLNELLGRLIRNYSQFSLISDELYSDYNWLIFNIYTIIFNLYFYYIFWCKIENKLDKKVIYWGAILFAVVSIVNAYIQNFNMIPQVYGYVFGGLVLIYCLISYFKKFFSIPKKFTTKEDILFWLSVGLLIFYVGYLPLKVIRYMNTMEGAASPLVIKRTHLLLIIASYTCIIVGFIRMKKRFTK